jgi:hypothetical protein
MTGKFEHAAFDFSVHIVEAPVVEDGNVFLPELEVFNRVG